MRRAQGQGGVCVVMSNNEQARGSDGVQDG
jgi:hypothetical protein